VDTSEVAVVGNGVMAAAVAWELARAGRRPLLVAGPPSPPDIGHVASGPAVAYAEASAQLGRAAARDVWEAHSESHERLRSFVAGLRDGCAYRQAGAFLLALDRERASLLADTEDMLREDGFAGEFLDHYMLEARLPLVGFSGGYWAAEDAEVDGDRLERALVEAARERGAVAARIGTVREIAVSGGAVEIVADDGGARVALAIVAQPSVLAWVGHGALTGDAVEIAAALPSGLGLPALARSADGRFRWHSSDAEVRLEADRRLDIEALLAGLPVREPSVRRATTTLAVDDGLPVIGPLTEGSPIALACAADPCGVAFAAARWIADWVRTGRDSSLPALRCSSRNPNTPKT
jgi:glycine/D-amino acid oxidase-like deaminating enzyme